MSNQISKVFRNGGTSIGVTIEPDGSVNVAATGTMSARTFARLAASVLCESNTLSGDWVGFPVVNDLQD